MVHEAPGLNLMRLSVLQTNQKNDSSVSLILRRHPLNGGERSLVTYSERFGNWYTNDQWWLNKVLLSVILTELESATPQTWNESSTIVTSQIHEEI